ncbi:acyl-CoA-binding protein [Motiliproteus sediminis]|uniref:acyl-CoA-binding protein n=1 Tax=Motiliproteus sediminis TaxID=1468178 RepID=UPI001AEF5352|nr:acyl-CoA-binding protein [Motiliproteus sediminis]
MTDLQQRFHDCLEYVRTADTSVPLTTTMKLEMYALFKQATEGDISGNKPGMTDLVNRAKYNAWEACKGLTSNEAMNRYIERVEGIRLVVG